MPLKSVGILPLFGGDARQDLPRAAELAWNVMQDALCPRYRGCAKRDILAV